MDVWQTPAGVVPQMVRCQDGPSPPPPLKFWVFFPFLCSLTDSLTPSEERMLDIWYPETLQDVFGLWMDTTWLDDGSEALHRD